MFESDCNFWYIPMIQEFILVRLIKIIVLEPVGFKGPSFSSSASMFNTFSPENSTVSLTCEAQAFPIAVFR